MSKIDISNNESTLRTILGLRIQDEVDRDRCDHVNPKSIKKLKLLLSNEELESTYFLIRDLLDQHRKQAITKTVHEKICKKAIYTATKTTFLTSMWIGRSNFDFFFPYLAGEIGKKDRMRGLAIEVDGEVHDLEAKMKKDTNKADALMSIGIGVVHIENCDLNSLPWRNLLNEIKHIPKLDFRAKRRLLANVYAYTILANKDLIENKLSKLSMGAL